MHLVWWSDLVSDTWQLGGWGVPFIHALARLNPFTDASQFQFRQKYKLSKKTGFAADLIFLVGPFTFPPLCFVTKFFCHWFSNIFSFFQVVCLFPKLTFPNDRNNQLGLPNNYISLEYGKFRSSSFLRDVLLQHLHWWSKYIWEWGKNISKLKTMSNLSKSSSQLKLTKNYWTSICLILKGYWMINISKLQQTPNLSSNWIKVSQISHLHRAMFWQLYPTNHLPNISQIGQHQKLENSTLV